MKKLLLLASFCLMMASIGLGQSTVVYGGYGYYLKHPSDWKVEEVNAEHLVKISSESQSAVLQVHVGEAKGRSAAECLNDWAAKLGYTKENTLETQSINPEQLTKIDAEDGATGVYKHEENGNALYTGLQVYRRGDFTCFLILTTMEGQTETIQTLHAIASTFGFND